MPVPPAPGRKASAAAEGVDDLHGIAFRQPMFGMAATRNDLAVDLHRHPAIGQALGDEQFGERAGGGQGERLAVQSDIHVLIVARSRPPAQRKGRYRRSAGRLVTLESYRAS